MGVTGGFESRCCELSFLGKLDRFKTVGVNVVKKVYVSLASVVT